MPQELKTGSFKWWGMHVHYFIESLTKAFCHRALLPTSFYRKQKTNAAVLSSYKKIKYNAGKEPCQTDMYFVTNSIWLFSSAAFSFK